MPDIKIDIQGAPPSAEQISEWRWQAESAPARYQNYRNLAFAVVFFVAFLVFWSVMSSNKDHPLVFLFALLFWPPLALVVGLVFKGFDLAKESSLARYQSLSDITDSADIKDYAALCDIDEDVAAYQAQVVAMNRLPVAAELEAAREWAHVEQAEEERKRSAISARSLLGYPGTDHGKP